MARRGSGEVQAETTEGCMNETYKALRVTNPHHGLSVGYSVILTGFFVPWYVRLWRWITRKKPTPLLVTSVTSTTYTVRLKS